MKSLIRKWLMGDNSFSAYSKITQSNVFTQRVWLQTEDLLLEISSRNFLLCIEPIVFGVWLKPTEFFGNIEQGQELTIYQGPANADDVAKNTEAEVLVQVTEILNAESGSLLLLKLKKSCIYQLDPLRRFLLFYRYYKDGAMPYSRFKSFVCAYSFPRRTRIVCFMQGDYYNIFPMDLLGEIDQEGLYVLGLRHTNVALEKIISSRKIVVCEVSYQYKDVMYELGKHHSSDPPPLGSLGFKTLSSRCFGFPVPSWVDSYKEIKIEKTINLGSHMLLWGPSIGHTIISQQSKPLYLVHFLHYLHHKQFYDDYRLV